MQLQKVKNCADKMKEHCMIYTNTL